MLEDYLLAMFGKVWQGRVFVYIIVSLNLLRIMLCKKEIEAMNIVWDHHKQYTIARVPEDYSSAEDFALRLVYDLRPFVAEKLGIDCAKLVLVAISANDKVVVLSDNARYRNWLACYFHKPSVGAAQFYDDVAPELILKKMRALGV